MANILDIFRTHSGHGLLDRSSDETGLTKTEISRAFTLLLPSLLSIHKTQCDNGSGKFGDIQKEAKNFMEYIEDEDFCHIGEKMLNLLLTPNQIEKFIDSSKFLNINQAGFEKLTQISAGVLFSILSEISERKSLKREDHTELLDSLAGINTKFDRDFIKTLIKDDDSPHLIDSAEKISLDSEDDDDEQSIIGGYSGGR